MLTKIFKIIIGFLIIISIQAVSHCIIQLLKLPLSEAILGLMIFTGLLK